MGEKLNSCQKTRQKSNYSNCLSLSSSIIILDIISFWKRLDISKSLVSGSLEVAFSNGFKKFTLLVSCVMNDRFFKNWASGF